MAENAEAIVLEKVGKRFGDGPTVLESIDLSIGRGECLALLGPSGCGKSTLLRLVAGLSPLTSGQIRIFGQLPHQVTRRMAFIFQEPTLLPWLRVWENISLPLRLRGASWRIRKERAEELCRLTGLENALDLFPRQLSGGMKMRVSLARALTLEPEVLLLDEPFGALDAMTRNRLQEELMRLQEMQGWTAIFVTHSAQEAVFLSHRVAILSPHPGRLHGLLPNPLPHPRTAETREQMSYQQFCATVVHALRMTMEKAA